MQQLNLCFKCGLPHLRKDCTTINLPTGSGCCAICFLPDQPTHLYQHKSQRQCKYKDVVLPWCLHAYNHRKEEVLSLVGLKANISTMGAYQQWLNQHNGVFKINAVYVFYYFASAYFSNRRHS
jgi:hypothetical protein